ncbi:hypothetical protein P3W24_06835 [Luteibacter sp. PPL201]|uniref:Uncharacterized protein n=1 Tax=Luteibacter sahnii TaxID=3021977 RepID=A0ABT6BBN6_9GAMM
MTWRSRAEQRHLREQDEARLSEAAEAARMRCGRAARALSSLLADESARSYLTRSGVTRVCGPARPRQAIHGTTDGSTVLEAVVWAGTIAALLSDAAWVGWLAEHHPAELEDLRDAIA